MSNNLRARVSKAGDYSDGFMIEQYNSFYPGDGYAVPAWDEMGLAELCGPFATAEAAGAALRDVLQYV